MICNNCPRLCGVDRLDRKGFCGMGRNPVLAKACLHQWEEPVISGTKGSGAVFFSGCSLSCIYCQNYAISHERYGAEITVRQLSDIFLRLQDQGAHNINLVNPTHFAQAIIESMDLVRHKLTIPVVWNSGGYENVETISALEGYIDVYLPDIKYFSPRLSADFSMAADYFEKAQKAVWEMYCQVGDVKMSSEDIILRGLIIRHLILPNCTHDSLKILDWIGRTFKKGVMVSLMSQYTPNIKAEGIKALRRKVSKREYNLVIRRLMEINPEYGFIQDLDSADGKYIPTFDLEGVMTEQ